ncbi:MAG: serine hydrolase domain-containing protein [Phycisphaerales bacterium JB054]
MKQKTRAGVLCVGLVLAAIGAFASAAWSQPVDLAERLEPIRAKHDLPALAALVTTTEGTVASGAVGVRKVGDDAAVTADDLWHLGSCTKSMAGTVAAILVDRGVIAWDTTVGEVFGGEFDDIRPAYLGVTLEQLMSHRGGVPTGAPPRAWAEARKQRGSDREQRDVFVRAVLAAEPSTEPGTTFEYSNQGITVAAAMLERAWDVHAGESSTSWEALATELLFAPLGITTAGFGVPGDAGAMDQPWGHRPGALPGGPATPIVPGPFSDNPGAITPAGRVHMSLEDWAVYVREHLRGRRGESELLPREAWEHLHTDPTAEDGAVGRYGMGWAVHDRPWGGRVIAHSGSNTMWFCVVWASPEKGFAVLVATNIGDDGAAKAADEVAGSLIGAFVGGEFGGE